MDFYGALAFLFLVILPSLTSVGLVLYLVRKRISTTQSYQDATTAPNARLTRATSILLLSTVLVSAFINIILGVLVLLTLTSSDWILSSLICTSIWIVLGTVIFIYLERKRMTKIRFDQIATTDPDEKIKYFEGIVRGFKESRQRSFEHNTEDVVWTFQLERHSDTEVRLEPIPVEMRGIKFSGYINEGNVVRLYEKSWQGGIVRTKRVHNLTFHEDIIAHGLPKWAKALTIGCLIFILSVIGFLIISSIIYAAGQ